LSRALVNWHPAFEIVVARLDYFNSQVAIRAGLSALIDNVQGKDTVPDRHDRTIRGSEFRCLLK
jgi:hypothetical protein